MPFGELYEANLRKPPGWFSRSWPGLADHVSIGSTGALIDAGGDR